MIDRECELTSLFFFIAGLYHLEATWKSDPILVRDDDIDRVAGIVFGEGSELSQGHFGELENKETFFGELLSNNVFPLFIQVLDLSEQRAREHFRAKFNEALANSWKTSLNWASHNFSRNNNK